MRMLNKSQKVLRWPFCKVTPDEFPRGWSGGREGAGCGGAPGVSPSPLHPLQVLPALAHYSLLTAVTGAECGQGRPGTEAPAAGGLTNGGWRGSGGEEGGVLAHQGARPGREADRPPQPFLFTWRPETGRPGLLISGCLYLLPLQPQPPPGGVLLGQGWRAAVALPVPPTLGLPTGQPLLSVLLLEFTESFLDIQAQ